MKNKTKKFYDYYQDEYNQLFYNVSYEEDDANENTVILKTEEQE